MAVELLAPAGNVDIARSAILSGADAIYIGPPSFGARKAAGNSMDDIARLIDFAHLFGVKVYLTMNTILYDNELDEAESIARRAEQIGADALIVQDMAYQKMSLGRIPLHASTQTFNFDMDRIRLVAASGFDRIVLERSLTLQEIRRIREEVPIEIETFVHGAMCVGFSGRCYLSQYLCNRSGNRGVCAQACRNDYSLSESDGTRMCMASPLLSVSDIDFSDRIVQLLDAGVTSLKIEGRLKDEQYVVNNVAYYSSILDKLGVERASRGDRVCRFTPDPRKSFSRGTAGHMFLDNPRSMVASSTKSLGEQLASVLYIDGNRVSINCGNLHLHNGDGVCWSTGGAYINAIYKDSLLLSSVSGLKVGDMLYRNLDKEFTPSSKDVERTLPIDISVTVTGNKMTVMSGDFSMDFEIDPVEARNKDLVRKNIQQAFAKSGDSYISVHSVAIGSGDLPFIVQARLNAIRREFLSGYTAFVKANYSIPVRQNRPAPDLRFPARLSYEWNVSNRMAISFYEEHGATDIEPALELQTDLRDRVVMVTRHCIRRQMGLCPKDNPKVGSAKPLLLENNGRKLRAEFDCGKCQMHLVALG